MTFEEALEFKKTLPAKIKQDELTYTVYVTPYKHEDFTLLTNYMRSYKITDETAKQFSNDGKYSVRGICFARDANMLWHYEIKPTQ